MTQYRYNEIFDRWVLIAGGRGSRPVQFTPAGGDGGGDGASGRGGGGGGECPFCPGHEASTPPEVYAIRSDGSEPDTPGWLVRVVPNKYPAVGGDVGGGGGGGEGAQESERLISRPGVGTHEVVIESPLHDRALGWHDPEQAQLIVRVLRDRVRFHSSRADVGLVTPFYNHGRGSGASLLHPHFQIIAQGVVPGRVAAMVERARRYRQEQGRDVFEEWLAAEQADGRRVVEAGEHLVAVCPFASMTPYEVWVVPRLEQGRFEELSDERLGEFAQCLQRVSRRLGVLLGDPDYNIAWHTAPNDGRECDGFRWFLQMYPRLHPVGGFELSTDVYINTREPEAAAADLRGVVL